MEYILMVALALTCALIVLFFFLGVGRVVTKEDQNKQFHDLIDALSKSEVELDRGDANLPDPKTWTGYWYTLAVEAGGKPNNVNTPGILALGVPLFLFMAGWLVFPGDLLGGFGLAAVSLIGLRILFKAQSKARLVLMDKQLPNLLSGIRANLQAGLTPQQAIVNQAKEIPAPLGDELKVLVEEMAVGVTLDVALRRLGNRVPSTEIQFLVEAFRISVESGADLDPLVENIQHIVVQRKRIVNALATAVANAQPAIWVTGVMIPATFLFSYYSSPEKQEFWLTFPIGLITFAVVAVFYVAGLFIARKQVEKVRNS